jgi:hypothetical protein
MWKSKKFIITVALTVVVLGGILGGFAVAQADEEEPAATTPFLDKVAEIYEKNTGDPINADELQKAFIEAGQAMKDEALDNYLQKLVKEDAITQEQADEYKAWLDARPEFLTEEFKNWMESRPPLATDEFKQWLEDSPDIPGLFGQHDRLRIGPFQGMQRSFGKFGGGFGGKFFGPCAPEAPEE